MNVGLKTLARAYCLLAGACDVTTGALLIAAPAFTLRLMRVSDALSQPAWMRFIGAFVFGVGAVYLYGILRAPRGGARLAHLMEGTALVRICIAAFTGGAIVTGQLTPAWLAVCLTDASFAIVQIVLLRKDAFSRED